MLETNEIQELILDSPIEFVLIGTYLNERVIIARSTNYEIDLLSELSDKTDYDNKSIFLKLMSFNIDSTFKISNISSELVRKSGMDRMDNLKFVWRGIPSMSDKNMMQKILDINTPLIYLDINRKRLDRNLKWILADLIYLANNSNNKNLLKIKNNRVIFWALLSMYIFFGILVFILFFLKKYNFS
jgi:hypothetical protein